MYPKLKEHSFIKRVPEKNENVFTFMRDGDRKVITLNESASMILGLCDGTHSIGDIVNVLKREFSNDALEIHKSVYEFIQQFMLAGIIEDVRLDMPVQDIVRGSLECYLPNSVCWEITDYCPLDCRHCYLPKKNNNVVSREDIEKVLNDIKHMGAYQVQLTGGEALTHPEFSYIIKRLTDMKLFVSVSTSGFYSNNEIWKALENLKSNTRNLIRVSLDGNQNTHNYIRRNKKAYSTAIKFIEKAVKLGLNCQVGTCLIEQRADELEDMIKLVKGLGVQDIEIGRISEQGNAEVNNIKTQWPESTYQEFLKDMKKKYETKYFKVRQVCDLGRRNCGAGYMSCRIKPNLDVTPCPMIEITMGNLKEESIDNVMKRASKSYFLLETPQEKFCSKCERKEDCKDCSAKGYNNKDRVENCVWYEESKKYLYMKNDAENFW